MFNKCTCAQTHMHVHERKKIESCFASHEPSRAFRCSKISKIVQAEHRAKARLGYVEAPPIFERSSTAPSNQLSTMQRYIYKKRAPSI